MASDLILTPAQAQAVYSAMCALDAVGGKLETTVGDALVRVGILTGCVSVVSDFDADDRRETYNDQAAFAAAYGLHQSRAVDAETRDEIQTIAGMAQDARKDYASGKRFTSNDTDTSTCMTIRVPVAMLNRIRELAQAHGIHAA
ncbi:hypothetical protein NAT65_28890 [Achromobacter xylosoxidans]|uniref:hypothetical protein n=1 Tax=Alcaligenes xylosoxydans xylosoxydans TaxID=85698 RepID=UPI00203C20B2|nr:hypothetical protein [Achromobacter xylosoxidans]MCM2575128.1 hypothetical protein [Achromobacter xylosoxidans]